MIRQLPIRLLHLPEIGFDHRIGLRRHESVRYLKYAAKEGVIPAQSRQIHQVHRDRYPHFLCSSYLA